MGRNAWSHGAEGFAIDQQETIARAKFERRFGRGNAPTGGYIHLFEMLNDATRRDELSVDLLGGVVQGFQAERGGLVVAVIELPLIVPIAIPIGGNRKPE